jgi:hypothetical protein
MLMRPKRSLDRLLTLEASDVYDLGSITTQPVEEMRGERWDARRDPVTSILSLRYRLDSFRIAADILDRDEMIIVIVRQTCSLTDLSLIVFGANMGEIIRFVTNSERERARLIREARRVYDNIFPTADRVGEKQNRAAVSKTVSGANTHRSDGLES